MARTIAQAATAQAWEITLMAGVMATAPMALSTDGLEWAAGTLSGASKSVPSGTNPVLLVHGLAVTKSCWFHLVRVLRTKGAIVATMSYSPFGASVEKLADQLADKVDQILADTGAEKINLVGHSMGGLVIAQALADGRLRGRVDTVVSIGTPFGGSPWASVVPLADSLRALRPGSPLLRRLHTAHVPEGVQWVAFAASLDMVVPKRRAVPDFCPARRVTVDDVGHLGMLHSHKVVDRIADALPTLRRPQSQAA
jgi:triacylglycerol esterase/lipase EstA (alpha/beta hydrolase family)